MCGIYGFDLRSEAIDPAQRMIVAAVLGASNDERGGHSWGVAAMGDDGSVNVTRGLGVVAPVAWKHGEHGRLCGHTRWATHGDKTLENAHPFEQGRVVGAHNGIIYNHSELNAKRVAAGLEPFAVDSRHLFERLSQGKGLRDCEGYGAIWWMEEGKLLICRLQRGELSLFGVKHPSGTVVGTVFSSEAKHAEAAMDAAGLQYDAYKVEEGQVYEIENGKPYVLRNRTLKLSKKSSFDKLDWRQFGAVSGTPLYRQWEDDGFVDFSVDMDRAIDRDDKNDENLSYEAEDFLDEWGLTPAEVVDWVDEAHMGDAAHAAREFGVDEGVVLEVMRHATRKVA